MSGLFSFWDGNSVWTESSTVSMTMATTMTIFAVNAFFDGDEVGNLVPFSMRFERDAIPFVCDDLCLEKPAPSLCLFYGPSNDEIAYNYYRQAKLDGTAPTAVFNRKPKGFTIRDSKIFRNSDQKLVADSKDCIVYEPVFEQVHSTEWLYPVEDGPVLRSPLSGDLGVKGLETCLPNCFQSSYLKRLILITVTFSFWFILILALFLRNCIALNLSGPMLKKATIVLK